MSVCVSVCGCVSMCVSVSVCLCVCLCVSMCVSVCVSSMRARGSVYSQNDKYASELHVLALLPPPLTLSLPHPTIILRTQAQGPYPTEIEPSDHVLIAADLRV